MAIQSQMRLEIILVRHGETEFNSQGRIQGTLDSPLTERGRLESESLGKSMQAWLPEIGAWFVSPQGRARESSRIIRNAYSKAGIRSLPNEEILEPAREIDCGQFEGKTIDDLNPEVLEKLRNQFDHPYPDGESILDVMKRSERVLSRIILAATENIYNNPEFSCVLISHGNFIRAFGAVLTGLRPEFALRVFQSNTGVCRLISQSNGTPFKILAWNDTSHVNGLSLQFSNLGTG